ncbi:MAG: 4-hydroxythreonine-4-phosphate dehydrogenase PdxA [Ignavibacteriales bacterium]|nr:4-hydroxythreonine-4-phosphate dehydrogenase PdxA [Ignavibacteriales bacterium]
MKKFIFTCGDVNGIGPEISIKAINRIYNPSLNKIFFLCPKNVFDNTTNQVVPNFPFEVISKYSNSDGEKVTVINFDKAKLKVGFPTKNSGMISYKAIRISYNLAISKKVDAIITSPISKTALSLANIKYPGHTEMLAEWSSVNNFMMMFLSDKIKCGLLTIHKPISKVAKLITKKRILRSIEVVANSLKQDFGIRQPKIAILGLNPHAGESGLIGKEEKKIIVPAMEKSSYSKFCYGPFVPDAFFANKSYLNYDFVLGMYHDQVLIPFKLLNFHSGVNYTAGLPIIRTSPDHGTAYDIAGGNKADENSLVEAFNYANKIIDNRNRYA